MHLIRFQFCINDNADVLVRIRPKAESYKSIIERLHIREEKEQAEFMLDDESVEKLTMREEDVKRAFKEQLSFFYYQKNASLNCRW